MINKVYAAVDCGIVVNPDSAANMSEGGIVDGIGNALFGELTFVDGVPQKNNFHQYRLIRQKEAPKAIEVHFVQNEHDPTGLGEPLFPPVFGALANALYKATGKRYYNQPFAKEIGCTFKLDMKQFCLIFTIVMALAGCGNHSDNNENGNDSTSTAPITDPSYNPKTEADSAVKNMNLDSTLQKDSGARH